MRRGRATTVVAGGVAVALACAASLAGLVPQAAAGAASDPPPTSWGRSGGGEPPTLGIPPLPSSPREGEGHPRPARIVSLNVCTDQILVDLVAPARIRALSWLAADPTLSAIADRAAAFPGVRDQAEEVLALDPDLVIAQEYSATATVSMLERLGRKVLMVPMATDFAGIRKAVRTIAAAVGEAARGEAIVARFDARIAAATPAAGGRRPTALAWEVNSLTSGPRTLLDAAMTAAGFDNVARTEALGPAGRLPLESLVAAPPDLLIFANGPDEFRTVTADNLRHPALREVAKARPTLSIGMPQWLCGTPELAGAVERLAAARVQMSNGGTR